MLFLKGTLVEKNEDNLVIKMKNNFSQKVFFTKEKVKNQSWLETILNAELKQEIIVGVYAFAVSYKKEWKCAWFVKLVLSGDIVK